MRALLVVLVACARAAPVAPTPPVVEAAPAPEAIAKRVAATYAGASTYADRGEVVSMFQVIGGKSERHRITFETAYRREGGFRFEGLDEGDRARAFLVWSADNKDAVTRSFARPDKADRLELTSALQAFSGALDDLVPALLGIGHTLPWLDTIALKTVVAESLRGHGCWRLSGGTTRNVPIEIWVDRESYLIRQIHTHEQIEKDGLPRVDRDKTITYDPIANARIAATQLAPPDLTGVKIVAHDPPVWIGIMMSPTSTQVTSVLDHSPAAAAGIQVGDEIASVDGHPIASLGELRAHLAGHPIGTRIPVEVRRNGTALTLTVEIARRPDLDELAGNQLLAHPAPDFALPALDGTAVSLAALRGKPVVLDFWATWCGPCAVTAPMLAALHAKHPEIAVIGISDEDEPAIRAHVADHPSTYPLVRDADAKISRAYFVSGIPMVVLVDKAGIVRFVGIGVDGAAALEAELAKLPP